MNGYKSNEFHKYKKKTNELSKQFIDTIVMLMSEGENLLDDMMLDIWIRPSNLFKSISDYTDIKLDFISFLHLHYAEILKCIL